MRNDDSPQPLPETAPVTVGVDFAAVCGNCQRFSLPAGEKMSSMHWGNCSFKLRWNYCSEYAPCQFEPSRFVLVQAKRAA